MKYITLLGLIILGIFLYESEALSGNQINVKNYSDVFTKLKYTSVSSDEIKTGAMEFAKELCQDTSFQEAAGETPQSCLLKLKSFKSACEDKIFGKTATLYSDKTRVEMLSDRYINCLST